MVCENCRDDDMACEICDECGLEHTDILEDVIVD